MSYNHLCDIVGRTITKENLRYITAEFGAVSLSYGAAVGTTVLLNDVGCSDELNVIGTAVAKTVAFWVGNIGIYKIVHDYQTDKSCRSDLVNLAKSNVGGTIITNVLRVISHYGILKLRILPYSIAVLVAYPLPGFVGTVFRHVMNYKNRLFGLRAKDQNLDDLLK